MCVGVVLNVSVQKKIAACARVAYISMPRNGQVVCLFVFLRVCWEIGYNCVRLCEEIDIFKCGLCFLMCVYF